MKNFNIVIKRGVSLPVDISVGSIKRGPVPWYSVQTCIIKIFIGQLTIEPGGNGVFENALLRPVPQTELDALLNGDEFAQNSGYNQDNILIT